MRLISFVIGTEKPAGNTVEDTIFKEWQPILVFGGDAYIQPNVPPNTSGFTHNPSTGVVDFTYFGGFYSGVVNFYCVPVPA